MGDARTADLEAMLPALLEAVRAAYDGDELVAFDATAAWFHGDVDAVEAFVLGLVRDPRWEARAAVPEVLRYLVGPAPRGPGPLPVPRALERACVLVAMADGEADARVRSAIVAAFTDLKQDVGDVLTAAFVCRFVSDADAGTREAVAGVLGGNTTDAAIATLLALSADPDGDVRDWACFSLGHQCSVDTDAIRDALAARLDDPHVETREEAATGLALRRDERGLAAMEALLAAFDDEGVSERVLMTACEAPSARYVTALEAIVSECPDLPGATEALEACRAVRRPVCGVHVGCACMRGVIFR